MMQQGGGQGSEGRHPSSPRGGGSSAGNNSGMPNFSLLGQQMNNFGSSQQHQQHHHHQNNQDNGNPASVNFALGVAALSQQQPFSKVSTNGDNGGDAEGFLSIQNMNGLFASGQTFINQNHQFMNQQMLQQQGPQANLGGPPVASGGVAPEFFMNALNSIQQNILRLQSMIPYMSQNQQSPNLAFQQQAAATISQIAQVAANMLPPQQPQQQQQPHVQQQQQQQSQNMGLSPPRPPLADPHHLPRHHAHHHQQQIQFVGASATQARNAIDGSPPRGSTNSGGSTGGMGNNPYPAYQGGGGGSAGMSADMVTTATSLASHIVAIGGGVSGNNPSNGGGAGQVLGVVPPKSSPSGGVQNFRGHSNHGASVATNMTGPAVVGRTKQQGSPRSNSQMGNGMERGPSLAGMAGDMSHMGNNNTGVNSGGMTSLVDDQDGGGARDDDDDGDGENLVPGSYDLVEMQAMEILAEHTHFCEICTKGFKRDANLRMHMRGHGDEYKTPAALARPDKASHELAAVRPRRFSCPYVGCKRNQKHRKFQALKTMLCVKNHYRRSHCPKILTCHKCNTKKFSVVADLKTHEKHCGCDKWQCSCGTTFSRKDKLFGHIGLFAGHTPATFSDGDSAGALDVAEMGGGGGHSAPMSSPGRDRASGYGLAGGGGSMNTGSATSLSRGGGSGMGLNGNGVQGLSNNRGGGQPGGGAMTTPNKDGSPLATENSSSSDSFQSSGLLSGQSMMLFSPKFYQATSGANSGADLGLH